MDELGKTHWHNLVTTGGFRKLDRRVCAGRRRVEMDERILAPRTAVRLSASR
jgi:hypothetical protein